MTQKDIARNLGISLITVQRALNNSGYVSAALRKRILDYVKKNAYVPHRASQALVRNRTINIGVFSSCEPKYFWDDIERGIMTIADRLRPFRYEVRYHRIANSDTKKYVSILKSSIRRGLDAAAFVNQSGFDMETIIGTAEKAGVPYLMYNIDAPQTNRLCYIGANYRAGGRLAANFIGKALSLKKNAAALVIGSKMEKPPAYPPNNERPEGFLELMEEQYPSVVCVQANVTAPLGDPDSDVQIRRVLKKYEHKVDAVYLSRAFNPSFHRALERLDYRNVLVVQNDIDTAALRGLEENLITAVVFQDPILQGYMAVRVLEQFLESKKTERPADIEIVHTLILRENVNVLRNHYLL